MASASKTPMEDTIRSKLTASLAPSRLEIYNDSHKHAHHAPMADSTSKETHFRLVIASAEFRAKARPARHRMVYALLRDEMAQDHGIHALQLKTLTPEEDAPAGEGGPECRGQGGRVGLREFVRSGG
ncbi:Ribose-phosphate diphosphokinase [Apiospora arundinis]